MSFNPQGSFFMKLNGFFITALSIMEVHVQPQSHYQSTTVFTDTCIINDTILMDTWLHEQYI